MIVEVNSGDTKKLVAVVGEGGAGIFFPSNNTNENVYITMLGEAVSGTGSLDELLEKSKSRKPVYEGDTVTLTF